MAPFEFEGQEGSRPMGFSRRKPAPEELFSAEPEPDAPPSPRWLPPRVANAARRRGVELIGLTLIGAGGAVASMLWSYHPDDPSFFNATGAEAYNLLGAFGASLADPMIRGLGLAAYAVPAGLAVWGTRLIAHGGEGRIWSRLLIGAPIAAPLTAAFAATNAPGAGWTHPFGLGGAFGDSIVAGTAPLLPMTLEGAMVTVSLSFGVLALGAMGFALGLDRRETESIFRWMGTGLAGAARNAGVMALAAGTAAARKIRGPRSVRLKTPDPIGARRKDPELRIGRQDTPLAEDDLQDDAVFAPAKPEETGVLSRLAAIASRPRVEDHAPEPDEPARAVVEHSAPKPATLSARAKAEREPVLALESNLAGEDFPPPPISLLADPRKLERRAMSEEALEENARMLETVLDDYGIRGEIVKVSPGPVVTMYELEPAPGLKASRVISLADDIARSMSALAARVSTVPGRSIIGIELPNDHREKVLFREIVEAKAFGDGKDALLLALGKDIAGDAVIVNLAKMPHLLIAGTTGSGKSVAINTMILSLLYRLSPKDCRMIMIDPKMLELSVYDGIPHLLSPVVTDPKKAVVALKWTVAEMEERYRKMSRMGVRSIEGYNVRVREALAKGENFSRTVQTGFDDATGEPIFENQDFAPEELPFIVVVVDEMADLMMVAGKEIEACIQRLAQMARASGIHLIMATQRPSVDVITGTIKANFPTRISFQVTSKIDSRTILGEQGAEQLLGMGDMLYMAGGGRITRVHGPFVSDEEVELVVNHLKSLGTPDYIADVTEGVDEGTEADLDLVLGLAGAGGDNSDEALYDQAVAIVARERKCSTSYIQRRLSIGYQKAARIVDQLEAQGVVSSADKVGKREILVGEV
ncbi:MAG: S-DNA-T family DNA segregation ATPase FtsK/SpoIIIE [Paracoccaceae bacterium]|jgi:S-DNA-T family DNA segregation ATPase FtsK/SpoIIIE